MVERINSSAVEEGGSEKRNGFDSLAQQSEGFDAEKARTLIESEKSHRTEPSMTGMESPESSRVKAQIEKHLSQKTQPEGTETNQNAKDNQNENEQPQVERDFISRKYASNERYYIDEVKKLLTPENISDFERRQITARPSTFTKIARMVTDALGIKNSNSGARRTREAIPAAIAEYREEQWSRARADDEKFRLGLLESLYRDRQEMAKRKEEQQDYDVRAIMGQEAVQIGLNVSNLLTAPNIGVDVHKRETILKNLEEINDILDTRAIAMKKDPKGLAASQRKDLAILGEYILKSKKFQNQLANGATSERDKSFFKSDMDKKIKTATNETEFLKKFETPLSREQKEKLLDFDTLARLSTEDYLKLWRHLNPQYISHVTRQGYRSHGEMSTHLTESDKLVTNFTDMLKSGKGIRSYNGIRAKSSKTNILEDDDTFRMFMEKSFFKNGIPKSLLETEDLSPSNIIEKANVMRHPTPDSYWRDRTSVHVSKNSVSDNNYGAESGNEVFYVFPADVIASQVAVSRGLSSVGERGNGVKNEINVRTSSGEKRIPDITKSAHNDISIYIDDKLPVDAGIVFLPKNTIVDPHTGSRYLSYGTEEQTGLLASRRMGGIPAKEYWENYFREHPQEKPAHIIYYDGDPQAAVAKNLAENDIYLGGNGDTSEKDGENLGFEEKIAWDDSEPDKQLKKETEVFFTKVADYIRSEKEKRK